MGYAYAVAAVSAWTVPAFTHRRATSARCNPMYQLAALGLAALGLDVAGMIALGVSPTMRPALLVIALVGGAVAVANLLCFIAAGGATTVLAMASGAVPGSLLLPITSGGSAVVVTVLSVVFLHERPGWCGRIGLVAGVIGMLLLGWATR